ncbi:MAG: alpha/beta hydrolase [Pseudomonadota bacterium]
MTVKLDGLNVAGLAWGPVDGRPILALHGWLDNAGSFSALGPLLTGWRVVAVDLPGNGLSDHRSPDATYNIWDDLVQIDGLVKALGGQAVLLGHSRGAIQSILYAAAQPASVAAVVALDALVSEPFPERDLPKQLGRFLTDRTRHLGKPERLFPDRKAFIGRRQVHGVGAAAAQAIAERALEPTEGGMRLRGDPRLMGASALKLTAGEIEAVLKAVRAPVLALMAEDGLRSRPGRGAERPEDLLADCSSLTLRGDHHFHLDPDVAPEIAGRIRDFLGGLQMDGT